MTSIVAILIMAFALASAMNFIHNLLNGLSAKKAESIKQSSFSKKKKSKKRKNQKASQDAVTGDSTPVVAVAKPINREIPAYKRKQQQELESLTFNM